MERSVNRKVFDHPDLTLCELMNRWPETVAIFARRHMMCIGCAIGLFHTISDACREYGLDEEQIRTELWRAITKAASLR